MSASAIKFSVTAIAETRDELLEKMEEWTNDLILKFRGEPWVVTKDEFKKVPVSMQGLLQNDPAGAFYHGERELVFTGPTQIGEKLPYRDGFRPQVEEDSPPSF